MFLDDISIGHNLSWISLLKKNCLHHRDFFLNLDNLHDYLKYTFPKVIDNKEEPWNIVLTQISAFVDHQKFKYAASMSLTSRPTIWRFLPTIWFCSPLDPHQHAKSLTPQKCRRVVLRLPESLKKSLGPLLRSVLNEKFAKSAPTRKAEAKPSWVSKAVSGAK